MAGGSVSAPLPPHMLKSWKLLGFDPEDKRDPFPPKVVAKSPTEMKRFYKDVSVEKTPAGFRILLDGKPVKTPGRQDLLLPTRALADAIAGEWRGQGEEIEPAAMPMLRLANTALDGVATSRRRGDRRHPAFRRA